jgi:O-antigen/teichoic acid export membrane protein
MRRAVHRFWRSPIVHGSFSGMVANFSSTGLFLVRSILVARALGSEVFGLMAYGLALAMFVAEFIEMRSGDLVVRFVGSALVRKENTRAATFLQLGILVDAAASLVAMAAIALIVVPLAGRHAEHEMLQALILIFMVAVPFRLLRGPFHGLLVTARRFPLIAILQITTRLFDLGAVVALLPLGATGVAWSYVLAGAFEFVLMVACGTWTFWRTTGSLRGADYRRSWQEFRPFAVYGSLLGSLQALTSNLDVVALGALRPPAEVGFYTIARSGSQVLTTALQPVSQTMFPLMNEAWARNDRAGLHRRIGQLMTINGTVSALAAAFILLAADWIVVQFYGPQYLPAGDVLRLSVVFIGLQTVTGWMRQIIIIAGYPRLDLIAGAFGTVFFLVLLAPAITGWGALGLAVLKILGVAVMVLQFAVILARRVRLWGSPAWAPQEDGGPVRGSP